MADAFEQHWREFLIEAAALGIFMVSACVCAVVLEHPGSPLHQIVESAFARRVMAGLAMGLTAVALISSAWGQRSGAHMNPAVTLSFFSLGKIAPWDAVFYIAFQFAGGIAGVGASSFLIGSPLSDAAVNYVATVPGPRGPWAAFAAELAISFAMMITILLVSNSARWHRSTPKFAGALVALFIVFEAPLSGMSLNPARSFASACFAGDWTALWVYFTAPPLGMLAAATLYRFQRGIHRVFCAKLRHGHPCIFRCNYGEIS